MADYLGPLVAAIALALTLIFRYTDKGRKFREDLAELKLKFVEMGVKVETMWAFQMRRAIVEGSVSGSLVANSPVHPTSEAKSWIPDSLRDDLISWYRTASPYGQPASERADDLDLLLAIEDLFGDRIMKEVCIPRRVHGGVCLIIALSVAREANGRGDIVQVRPHSDALIANSLPTPSRE